MADGRHIENRLLAIYRRHIGRIMRNSEWIKNHMQI